MATPQTVTATFQSGQTAALSYTVSNGDSITSATILMKPVSGSGSSYSLPVTNISTGSPQVLTFALPSLTITVPTDFFFSASGRTALSTFNSAAVTVTVQPGPAVVSVAPPSGTAGTSLDVVLTGISTQWVNGTTQASFGAGIAVGGGTAGAAGPVSVASATRATAHLVIAAGAAIGAHDVTVITGSQNLVAAGAFNVTAPATAAPQPPVASAGGPYTATAGTAVTLSAAGSTDPQGQALTYSWAFGDGSTDTGAAPAHTYATAGSYTATVTVTNTSGLSSTAAAKVTVTAATSTAPTAVINGPYTGTVGTAIAFRATGSSDPRGQALTYAWNFGDGGTATGATPSHTFSTANTFAVTLTVTNTSGQSGTAATTATVTAAAAQPPVASAGGPYSGAAGTAITFDGTGSTDPKGETLTYAWSFGDGSNGAGAKVPHAYTAAGTYTARLTVTNTDGLSSSATATVSVSAAAPQAPTAKAGGPYTGVAGTAVTFDGSGSTDPRGEALTYAWTFGDGGTATGVAPSHVYSGVKLYTVTLTVTNTDGQSGSATTTANITAAGQAPVAAAGGPYSGAAGTAIAFDGSGSTDPKNEVLTYAWNFGDGITGGGAKVSHTYAAAGTYTAVLTVTNTDGISNSAQATVTVSSVSQAPTAVVGGPYSGVSGTAISFSGSGSTDPRGEALTYAWTFGDGATASGVAPAHAYAAAGTYTVTLQVTNTDGLSGSSTTTATVSAAKQAPTANAGGPYTGVAGTNVAFDGSGSTDPQGRTLTYSWNFGDGSTATGATPSHSYDVAGTYTATLTVTNPDALSATATAKVTISNTPKAPVASAGGPYQGNTGTAVAFNGSGSADPQGETLTYAWTFGDGGTAAVVSPSHVYTAPGTYTVTLTVTNTDKLTGSATTSATITTPGANQPTANPGGPYTGTAGSSITFNGLGSSDPKNEALTYAWNFGDGAQATGAQPTHTYAAAGSYTVTLTVTNTDGQSGSGQVGATIASAPTQAPVVYPGGPYQGFSGNSVRFNGGSSYDPSQQSAGVQALTLTWNFGDGTQASGPSPVHVYSAAGTYTVTVTATNSAGVSASATATATIQAGVGSTPAPTGNAGGPYSAALNAPIQFNGSGSTDPKGAALTYSWDFGDGTSGDGVKPTHAYAFSGNFSVVLTVSNGSNLGYGNATVTIAPGPPPPALVADAGGPYTTPVSQPLKLDGSKTTNPSSQPLQFTWDFGDGSVGSGVQPIHVYAASGTYTVHLNVQDGLTGNGNATTTVTVGGPAPEQITPSAGGPYTSSTGTNIVLDASASTDNLSKPLTYAWDFGDGTSGTGVTPTHAYATAGNYTAKVTVTGAVTSATANATVNIAQAISVTVTSPAANKLFGPAGNTVTVTGTASSPNLSIVVNGVPATVSGTSWSAAGVSLREGVNLITATATDGKGGIGTGSVSVQLDATAPTVSITAPAANSVLSAQQITVTGLINDIVTGTIGSNDISVTVNGQPAQVVNRSYMLSGVVLVPGTNTITVVAADRVGNTGTATETVQVLPATSQLSLQVVSGNNQTGAVHTVLPQPLVVQLVSAAGVPVAGRPITFSVTRSDGMVEAMPNIAQTITLNSDANGKASLLFQLGSRSGLGVNQVSAATPGAAAAAVFAESSTIGGATQIHSVRGESQRGLLGAPLSEAFQVIVQDGYSNPVPGVTVQFATVTGDGTLSNTTATTDSNGKAISTLTLGQQEGIGNYAVSATFDGYTGSPVTFKASGFAPGPVAQTSVSGIVLDNANMPIANATVTLANTNLTTTTDTNGLFKITGAPVGTVTLTVDGSTSTRTQTFPFLSFVLNDLPGQNNSLSKPIYLPFIDANSAQTVGGDDPVTLAVSGVPGVAFTIAPHSVTFPDGSTVGKMSLSQVKSDMVPMEPTNGTAPDLIWTLQPAGTRFSVPVQVTLPNTQGLAPGYTSEFYQYDHDLEQFVSAGTMHVSADGSVMVSDPGFGITKAGWGHGSIFAVPPACVFSCKSTTPCITLTRSVCNCTPTYNNGIACGDTPRDQCHTRGECQAGFCTGTKNKPNGTECTGGLFCNIYACDGGTCKATPKPVKDAINGTLGPGTFESTLTLFAEQQKAFFEKIGLHIIIKPDFSAVFVKQTACCEAKRADKKFELDTLNAGVKIEGPPVIPIIGGVPLGVDVKGVGIQGLSVTPSGTIAVTGSHLISECDDKNCYGGGGSVGIGLTGQLEFGSDQGFKIYASVGSTLTGSLVLQCKVLTGTIAFSGIQVKTGITYYNGAIGTPLFIKALGPSSFVANYDFASGTGTYGLQ